MVRRLTHEQFMKDFHEKNTHANDIEILGEYQRSDTPIHCRCRIDGHEWFPKPNRLLQNRGCPKCAGNIKKTNEQFLQELKEVNPYVKPLEDYKNALTQIKCECLIDGEIWYPTPSDLINNLQGCPECARRNISEALLNTHEEFMDKFYERNIYANDINIKSEYKGTKEPIDCECRIGGYQWSPLAGSLLSNHGCPICAIRNHTGENNPRWNPNITQEEREQGRKYIEYYEFIKEVFERDNYTCQVTGQRGGKLVVHHLYSYNKYRCLRTVIENGITVSEEIHKEFHSVYGYGNNTLEQWEEFINNYYNKDLEDRDIV